MTNERKINFGGRLVGDGEPCFIIAEIGANHNRDFDLARRLIDSAISAGADCVKFQTFLADKHFSKFTPSVPGFNKHIHQIIKETEIERSWLPQLKDHVEEQGAVFLSSLGDFEAVKLMEELNVVGYKNTSFEITDLKLITAMAKTGKPIILSTGLANMDEIGRAVTSCNSVNNQNIILLQCTSLYPAPPELANLRAMQTMRNRFGVLVGYSDHTPNDHIALGSVALEACVLEKHFTLNRELPGPDHHFAMEPVEFESMIKKIREFESAIGDGIKIGPRTEELDNFKLGRRSIHAAVDISLGTIIEENMLCVKRPGFGIEPYKIKSLVGRRTLTNIKADQWISDELLQ